jgi:hypothetical protein
MFFFPQMLMNATPSSTIVTPTHIAMTLLVTSCAPANLDLLETGRLAQVRLDCDNNFFKIINAI